METKKSIDCLLIGHNEIEFEEYERIVGQMGPYSGAYRDLRLNYIRYDNKPYTAAGIFNLLNQSEKIFKPVNFGETFSAAVAYLGSYLKKNGFTIDYINSFQKEKPQLKEKLEQNGILTIAIITTLYVFPLPIIEIINLIKNHNHTAKIIVGGPFVSTKVRTQDKTSLEYLFTNTLQADFFVNSSQGEAALLKILQALKNDLPLHQINNIYYRAGNKLISTPASRENNQLTENPVRWDLFSRNNIEYVNVRTAISCPFSCAFCGFPQHAGKHQVLDVGGVEWELNLLEQMGTVKSINFIDDTFNIPSKRIKDILNMMIRNRYPFKWHSYLRCQYIDEETVKLMKESGCEGVFLGIESGNEKILKNMNKKSDVGKYLEGIALLKKQGIVTFGSFIIGFPGETDNTVEDTKKFIMESGLDFYRVQLWYCEPITPIWKEKEKYNITGESFEWSHATMDSRKACDLIDETFCSIENPIWVPQYNFDFDSMWHLIHQGISLENVKDFLRTFYMGLKEKLLKPNQKEVSHRIIQQLMNVYRRTNELVELPIEEQKILEKYNAEFDY
jgi:anaerobic magnesium-protoporphyrin IX monomethyl ester cyclase